MALSQRSLARGLVASTALVAFLGLCAEVLRHARGIQSPLIALFSLSEEANLPTWYSSMLLFACALALVASVEPGRFERRWWGLAIVFVYLSLDEAAQIHEHLHGLVEGHGFLYYSWVVPAGALVLAMGLSYLPFLAHLPPRTRRKFILAGALYVGGALVMELPLGWWAERHGDDNLTYALIDFVEETLEMAGAAYFLHALVQRLEEARR